MSTAALIYHSDHATGKKSMPTPSGPEVVNVLTSLTLTSAQVDALAANDIVVMGYLPENCAFVGGVCAMTTGIDTGNGFDLDFGVVLDAETDLAVELYNSALVDAADGSTSRRVLNDQANMTEAMLILNSNTSTETPNPKRKKLGFKVSTAATTPAAGTLYLSLSYRATSFGA